MEMWLKKIIALAALFGALDLCITVAGATAGDYGWVNSTGTLHEFNGTGITLASYSGNPDYRITPEPVRVQIELNETRLPAPKGEMALGPRTIGFSTDWPTIAIVAAALAACIAGLWYLAKRNTDIGKDEENK